MCKKTHECKYIYICVYVYMKKYQGIILIHIWNISNLPEVTAVSFHLPTCPYFPWTLNVHQVSSNSSSAEPEKSHVAIVRPFHMHWWRRCPRPHLVSPFEIPWPLGRVAKLFAIASLRVFVLTQQDLPHDIQIYIYIYVYLQYPSCLASISLAYSWMEFYYIQTLP